MPRDPNINPVNISVVSTYLVPQSLPMLILYKMTTSIQAIQPEPFRHNDYPKPDSTLNDKY
jgi:hypothetical protein